MRVRKPNVDWNLDLKPARPKGHSNPAVPDVPPANGVAYDGANHSNGANGAHPSAAPPQELLDLINDLRRHVATLDTRLQAIESALARARRASARQPARKAASATPPPLPAPATRSADSEAPETVAEPVTTVKRVRATTRKAAPPDSAAAAS